ncbi:MAG: serine/threonine-protein kinase [Archangium sp.]
MRLAGRYELIERLAEGGMAEVWLATAHGDAGFTRRVAIKQLFPRQHDAMFERMFLDEARLTSRLHHQAIVSILDFGVESGRPFQVLEFVDGYDAWRLWKWGLAQDKRLSLGLVLHICAQVGHALHFAHCARDDANAPLNIVHRDVSPQNVLLSRAGDVKLSDFGIAFAEGRLEKTIGGIARGKPAYMAPEQAVRGAMDGRTDVFALGCVLHALLTGESALREENSLVDLLAGEELKLEPTIPDDVREVIAKAVRRDKSTRFENAEELALACAALVPKYLNGDPRTELSSWVRSVTPELPVKQLATPQLVPPKRSRRVRPFVALAAATALTVTGVGYAMRPEHVVVPPQPLVVAPLVVEKKPEPVVEVSKPVVEEKPAVKVRAPVVAAAVPKKFGVLAVGGERLLRGEVHLDGKVLGVAPARFDVEVGTHQLEVLLPSGETIGPRAVTVGTQHTALAPLYLLE